MINRLYYHRLLPNSSVPLREASTSLHIHQTCFALCLLPRLQQSRHQSRPVRRGPLQHSPPVKEPVLILSLLITHHPGVSLPTIHSSYLLMRIDFLSEDLLLCVKPVLACTTTGSTPTTLIIPFPLPAGFTLPSHSFISVCLGLEQGTYPA